MAGGGSGGRFPLGSVFQGPKVHNLDKAWPITRVPTLWRIAKGRAEKKAIFVDGGARLSFKLQLIQHHRRFAPVDGKARRSSRRLASVKTRERLSAAERSVDVSKSAAMSLTDTAWQLAARLSRLFGRLGAKNGTLVCQLSCSVVSCFAWRASFSHTRDRSTRDDEFSESGP